MNKKGFVEFYLDVKGWLIFTIGMLFWLVLFVFFKPDIIYEIAEETPYLSDDSILLTYLRAPTENKSNVADLISEVYFGASPDKLTLELNKMLNSVYGTAEPVCWRLWYYDPPESTAEKSMAKENCTGEKRELLDSSTIIPLQNKKPIRVRLIVPGYK